MTKPVKIFVRTILKSASIASAIALACLPGFTSAAAAPGVAAGCPNVNPELEISVAARVSEFHKEEARVVLQGDVTIDQGVLHLAADEVTIEYRRGDTRDLGTQGKVNALKATGTVKIVCENDRAHGGEALYDVPGRTITLTHDVLLVRGGNILKGQKLFIDLATGHMSIEGGGKPVTAETPDGMVVNGDTRIKAIFTPVTQDDTAASSSEEANK
jgi:lipopolysaccharide export system protein LptA